MNVKNWKDRLKEEWDRDPVRVMVAAGIVATGAAKLLDAVSAAQGRRAYARQVEYRVNHKK